MALILGILKIIGICILFIILFLILCILAVLFVPLRYKIATSYDEAFDMEVRVTWLLHLLGFRMYYKKEEQNVVITLLGIPIWDKMRSANKKNKRKKRIKRQRTGKTGTGKRLESSIKKDIQAKTLPEHLEVKQHVDFTEESEDTAASDLKLKDKVTIYLKQIQFLFKRLINSFKNIKYTFIHICDKIKENIDNITYYKKLLQNERIQNALNTIKQWSMRFLRNIRPQKLCANITFGMDNPSTVADILAVYSVLYPWIGQSIFVYPHFEDTPVKFDLFMKGRITIYWVAYAIWKYLFDKNIRYLKRRFVREEK